MDELVVPIEVDLQTNELVLREKSQKDLHHLHLNSWGKCNESEKMGLIDEAEPLEKMPLEGGLPPRHRRAGTSEPFKQVKSSK